MLSDIAALRYDYRYEYKKQHQNINLKAANDLLLTVYLRYTDNSLLEKLEFEHITERFYADDNQYVIGQVRLQNLLENKDLLAKQGVFIAEIPGIDIKVSDPQLVSELAEILQ